MNKEKLCLRWNDFEHNISESFCKIRDDKDFFDITLACGEKEVQAHKIILSACSPFFKKVLQNHPHSHPLIYLTGVKYQDLEAVLNFMYHGQVNVAHDELNSFLQVAEDLKVKGLNLNTASDKTASKNCLPRLIPKPDTFSPMPQNDAQDLQEVSSFVKSELWDNHPSPLMIEKIKQENIDNESFVAPTEEIEDYNESPNQKLLPFKSFYCDECDKKFTYKKTLQNHKLSYHGAGGMQFPCDLCDHQSNTTVFLKRHVNSVHGSVMYPCDQCDYQTPKLANLKRHVNSVHGSVMYPCEPQADLNETHHHNTNPSPKRKRNSDNIPDTNSTGQLTEILQTGDGFIDDDDTQSQTKSQSKVDKKENNEENGQKVASVTGGKQYICVKCDKQFSRTGFYKHNATVHEGVRYYCDQCDYKATQKSNLKLHIISIHEGVRYYCDQCDYKATQKSSLKIHISAVHEGAFQCDKCSKCFKTKSDFKGHQYIHSETKDFMCNQCAKSFSSPSSLETHKKTHGEKLHECDHCQKRFHQISNLNTHKRLHSGERPYICDVCQKNFVQKGNLKSHMEKAGHWTENPVELLEATQES